MKALFVSTHFPTDPKQSASGTYKRMRLFLDALHERASIRLLIYADSDLRVDAGRTAEAKAFLQSAWGLDDVDIVVCSQDPDPEQSDKLWEGYLSRALSMHRQVGYVRTSGSVQLRAFEACLADAPDLVFAHRLSAMCPVLQTKRRLSTLR